MTAIADTFEALLESDHSVSYEEHGDDGIVLLEDRQGRLCLDLLQQLQNPHSNSNSDHTHKNDDNDEDDKSKNSIRQVLGGGSNPSAAIPVLVHLLSHRVDTAALLPATQDEAANAEILENSTSAMTLTSPAIQAAALYARLLSLPGALGSGLVELEALTALTAVVRRWTLECCGREDLFSSQAATATAALGGHRKSHTKSPPKKKSRRKPPSFIVESEDDEDFPLGRGPKSILQGGLQVALALCQVPRQREFSSWSTEAREVVLDALLAGYGTTAALKTLNVTTASQIVPQASLALQDCLALSSTSGRTQKHETAVVILRGILNLLQFKEILPNGERGKLDAHTAASQALQGLIKSLSTTTATTKILTDASNQQLTPSRGRRRRSSLGKTPGTITGKTPKSQRKRRLSLDGATPMTSPALKGRRQSVTTGLTTSAASSYKPRPVHTVFLGMLQKLACSPGLERASARKPTVEALQRCIAALPLEERAHFLRYLLKLSQSKISMHRLVACEVMGSVLAQDWLPTHAEDVAMVAGSSPTRTLAESPISANSSELSLPAALWKALQGRLVDRIAAVRARAATSLEEAIKASAYDFLLADDEALLMSFRKRALRDDTAIVRKAAILAMTQVLLRKQDWMSEYHVAALCDLCQDSSLWTRKAAAESLTQLLKAYLEHPFSSVLEEAWSSCVLPMVLDDDAGSKAVMFLDQVVIAPVLENNSNSDPRRQAVAWRILAHVGSSSGLQGGSKGATLALQAALKQLAHDDYGRIHNQLLERVSRVAKQTLDEESSEAQVVGVWCLLEALLSSQSTEINTMVKTLQDTHEGLDFCVHAWKTMLQRASQNTAPWIRGTLRSCLLVVTKLASGLDGASGEDCMRSLQRALEGFIVPPDVIGAGMDALVAVSACSDRANVRKVCSTWIRSLFTCCEEELANFVQDVSQAEEDFSIPPERQQKLVRALFTVGELSMVGFRPDDDERDVRKDDADMLRGMHERPSKRLQELMQTMLSTNLPGSKRVPNPVSVRAHAFTVLGKLCLRDEGLAKASLNIFARELHPSLANPTPAVQSNALLVLGDLCVRYTNMTDRYLPVLASCLQAGASNPETNLITNSNPGAAVVRKHAVLLLSSLLLQDYIKWRGLLFHRFLVACSDEDEGVAQLAESVLSGPLFARNQKLFFNHFVEALFVLNKCTAHPIYVSAATHGDGGSGIAVGFDGIHLNGAVGQARRRRMYDFLLSKLSDEEKIGITARLAKEVLGGAVSSEGDLGRVCDVSNKNDFGPQLESAWNVMTDAFYVLTSKAIKVGKLQEEDDIMEDPNIPNPSRQVNVATSRLMSKISRKHLIESVLPILCNLKTKLQASCSPLLKDLMIYLLWIFRSYKVEVKEYLANDPILLQEIEYDARQQGGSNSSSQ